MKPEINMKPFSLAEIIGKPSGEFTKSDLISFVCEQDIRLVNFMYPAADGRLKTLNFVITDVNYLDSILTSGERVDGSSIFSFIEAGNSDLYVIPRYSTAFMDPFSSMPTLSFLCAFFTKEGDRLESSPEYILHKADKAFTEATGLEFQAMGELEYYVSSPMDDHLSMFPAANQKGYHESAPFAKFNDFRTMCMYHIAQTGGMVKYGHSEVGNFILEGRIYEQNEIEFLPTDIEQAADQLMLAKWIIRNLAYRNGLDISFAPKITEGKAGSGLHVHMRILRDGINMMLDEKGVLSETARKAIAGMMTLAPSITAFGNTNPTSYFRLVPHQEAPTNVCWGDRNRSVLVRVPLGWTSAADMSSKVNPLEAKQVRDTSGKQTVEIRSADGSANIYMLLSAVCVACRRGLEMKDALAIAQKTYVDVNIHSEEHRERVSALEQLPDSCVASAAKLKAQREAYEEYGVFDSRTIDGTIRSLEAFNDSDIRSEIKNDPEVMRALVRDFYYCG